MNCTITAVATSSIRRLTQIVARASTSPSTMLPTVTTSSSRHDAPAGDRPGGRGADREPVDQERAGVVEEALALEDDEQPVRRAELPEHRGRGRRVGRRDDGAERDGGGPRQLGHQPPGRHRDRRHGERHGDERQARDRTPILPQVPGRGVERRVEQHRRHEQCERELGVEHDRRHARHQGECRAGQREERGVGRADAPRARGERGADQQEDDDGLEDAHRRVRRRLPGRPIDQGDELTKG